MSQTYIVGEIGQNHNGSVELARQMIDLAAKPIEVELFNISCKGMDAVKLTKRDLDHELSVSAFNQPYDSPHSFGRTYGEHRKALELSNEQHYELFKYAKSRGLDFIETLCSAKCLSLLKYFTPDRIKVASRDLNNVPLLEALAETQIPIILSTGMSGREDLDSALEVINRYHSKISILHCVSEYPTRPEHANLNTIKYLKRHYDSYKIGYSDHTIGISAPVAAVALGAEIIEKHITLDRSMKGTDQAGSLGVDGLQKMVRDLRLLDLSLGKEDLFIDPAVKHVKNKLQRSIASNKFLKKGHVISQEDLHLLSPGYGFSWKDRDRLIGKKLKTAIPPNEIILGENIIE